MGSMNFQVVVEDDGTLLVLRLHGALDLATMRQVEDAVKEHCRGRQALVIDMRELEFMDSSGLRLMIELNARDDGTTVAFRAPPDRVGRVLDMTGVRETFTWVTDPSDALRANSRASTPVTDGRSDP
jgi:anti-anti-sigma factor